MFIKLTSNETGEAIYLKSENIDGVEEKKNRGCSLVHSYYEMHRYVKETPEEIINKIKECEK